VRLNLRAERPILEPIGEGRGVVPRTRGFGSNQRPGEPMLPLKILLVAIPDGSVPTLSIVSSTSELIPNLEVAPVPHLRVRDRGPRGRGVGSENAYDADRRIYDRDREFPRGPVRLGSIGTLRRQRFVEVIFTPVLFDPSRRQIRYFPSVDVEVRFAAPEGSGTARPFRPDPFFETIYRDSLVNYEQGKAYRLEGGEEPSSTSSSSIGATASVETANAAPRYKIMVSRSGIYRLDHTYLGTHAPDLLSFDPRTWVLSAEGVDVPVSIRSSIGGAGEGDGLFDPGDFLEFYGRKKTEPATVLNHDFGTTFPDIHQANDFTDTQVYWLTASEPAGSHPRIPETSGAPVNGWPQPADFEARGVWEENNLYFPLGANDPFFSIPSLLAGGTAADRDLILPLPGLASAAGDATVTLRLRGATSLAEDPDHRTTVWLNSDTGGGVDFTWDGEVMHEEAFTVAHSVLTDPVAIHVSLPGLSGVVVDRQLLDVATVLYRRRFEAEADRLDFTHPNDNARFVIGGFGGPEAAVYDISRTLAGSDEPDPIRITDTALSGAPTTTYTFEIPADPDPTAPATRTFAVAGPLGLLLPDAVELAADPVLKDPTLEADLIVIAARDAVDASPGGSLDNLLQHRLSAQGLTSKIVYMDQIADEFGFGLRDPNALRSFLSYAFDNWKGSSGLADPPSFVLLVGDATPDYKNTLGRSDWIDQVPTPMMLFQSSILGYYSSDNWTASFRGDDQLPDVFFGRISTRTAAASAAVFEKILRYEQSPPPGLWKGRMVLAAGDGKVSGEAEAFQAIQDDLIATRFSDPPFSTPDPPLYFAQPPWNGDDATGFNTAIIDELQAGAAILSYIGHGSFDVWGLKTFMTVADADALTNDGPLPFMVIVNCLTGGFHWIPEERSIGEAMTNNPAGGAIASLAPAGLSNLFIGDVMSEGLFEPLFGPQRERVLGVGAHSLRMALWSRGSIVDLQSFAFLGDPATRFATPAPSPPTALTAVSGNGEVELSWVPPAEPADGVRIYRAIADPAGTYNLVPCEATSTTSCVDGSALNAATYYYYAVSHDTDGFEGRASNFNTDCDTGPDCVVATPTNPDPPSAPVGLSVIDAGTGGRLDVSWQANPENDIETYTLYYGTTSGQHDLSRPVDSTTLATQLTGLVDGITYYLVLTATNTSGLEGPPSEEVSAAPRLIMGLAPPRAISDLAIRRSIDDLILEWSRPTVDIYDRPTTVVGYEVFRGATPGFIPSAATLLATLADGALTDYTDAGGATLPGPLYYLVRAFDADGLVSGAGRDLPNGIRDLGISHLGPGAIRLSWSAVTTDVRGLPTLIDHYEVHSATAPFGREAIGPGTLLVDNIVDNMGSLSVDLSVTDNLLYFSVIAVDNRGNLSPF
jgi:hypothetical protein